MNGADFDKVIDDELWNDIQDIFEGDQLFEIKDEISPENTLDFVVSTASGFRFRYQSEIDKKSFSSIKGDRNQIPCLKVLTSEDMTLRIDLVTENSTLEGQMLHFNTLYEIPKVQKYSMQMDDGFCLIEVRKNIATTINLDFLGIRKLKLKEAIPRIQSLYPDFNDAKKFYNDNKETVKLRALLFNDKYILSTIMSNTIKSQNAKENKDIKIQYISPKIVADQNEMLIIVLEKKITSDCCTFLEFETMPAKELYPVYKDGQTFVYPIPVYNLTNTSTAQIRIRCSDHEDSKPIRFIQQSNELRKRKLPHYESDIPLKKPANYDSPQQLVPETCSNDRRIEFDGPIHSDSSNYTIEYDSAPSGAQNTAGIEYDGPVHADCNNDTIECDSAPTGAQNTVGIEYGGPNSTENGKSSNIEYDIPHSMDVVESHGMNVLGVSGEPYISGNESCKDSGIHSNERGSESSDSDDSFDDSDDDSDEIEIEGVRRRRVVRQENLEPINFPPTKRPIESYLNTNRTDKVAQKIFSEVARVGHDYAFGKTPGDLFERMEKQLPVVFTLQDDVGDTPLNNAILKGNIEQAERILKVVHTECKWALDLANTSGHTALILAPACEVPASFIVRLLDAGCQLNLSDDLDKTAITYAIEYKNTEALAVLLEYIKNNKMYHLLKRPKKVYHSYLHIAIINEYVEGVKMLLSLKDSNGHYMVDVNEFALMNEDTALHIAVERTVGLKIVRLLLERPDIDLNHKKDKGTTVLHTAIKMGQTDVVELLKSLQAEDVNEHCDSDEIHESVDEMDDDDESSTAMACDIYPVIEMTPHVEVVTTDNIVNLITKMESMSLNGDTRRKLIELLISDNVCLDVSELTAIIKPAFRSLLSKYHSTKQHQTEIVETLNRFNCLPNSLGQLCEKLQEINRFDIIRKVADHFID